MTSEGQLSTMEHNEMSRCMICEQLKPMQEGIFLISEFICSPCESEIVNTDVQDAKYPFFIRQLKRMNYRQNA